MTTTAETVLTKGLKAGYAGGTERLSVLRGPFHLAASEQSFPELSGNYSDQWIFKRVGGGQEIARSGNDMATRVFAGGIVKPDILRQAGVTEEQVLAYHKQKLSELADKTRLHEDITIAPDDDWHYAYRVLKDYPDLPLTVGVETIAFRGQDVFVHVFLTTPIV